MRRHEKYKSSRASGGGLKLLLVVLLGVLSGWPEAGAQHPWSVFSVEELGRSDVYLLPLRQGLRDSLAREFGVPLQEGVSYHVSGPHPRFLRGDYMYFVPLSDTLAAADAVRVPVDRVSSVLPFLVLHAYWERLFGQFLRWSYVDMGRADSLLVFDTAGHCYGRYSPLHLLSYRFRPEAASPVVFTLTTNTPEPQRLPIEQVQRLAEAGAFATEADIAMQERQARLSRSRDMRSRDSVSAILDSLDFRRLLLARQADSLASELEADSLAQERQQQRAEVERTKKRMDSEQIFLINVKPARSDYMFGIELNLYNCFPRTIASIELTIAPYNERGQLQQDKFRRTQRTMRCMGPVEPGQPAQYTFDELFWDDRGNIKYMRLTAISFRFTDGTRKSYSGYNQILKHTLNH